jgi:hypothetical protein
MNQFGKITILLVVLLLAGIQFIQPDRVNPQFDPARSFEAVAQSSPEAVAVVKRACYDCHSDTTFWPWYSRVAPVSWLLAGDVKGGRAHLNFSEWGLLGPDMAKQRLRDACEEVKAGDMPLWQYRLMHSQAKLSAADINAICSAAESR